MIFSELSLCSARDGESGSCWEPSSRVELHEKFLAKRLALSIYVAWTIKKKMHGRLPHVKNAVANPSEFMRSDKLRCNIATSYFHIIGACIFEDSLTVITRTTKQFLISRSHISDGTDENNGCNVQWQRHKV